MIGSETLRPRLYKAGIRDAIKRALFLHREDPPVGGELHIFQSRRLPVTLSMSILMTSVLARMSSA